MAYTDNAKNGMADQLRGRVSDISIHTADPGTTGTNEVTGGGYARVSFLTADWDAATGGAVILNKDLSFSGPASGGATHFGLWDGATFLGGGANTGDTSFNAEGELLLKATTEFNLNS